MSITQSERLNKVKKHLKLTNKELGAVVGVTDHAIAKAMNRDNVKPFYLDVFQEKFGISRKYVETGEGEMTVPKTDISDIVVNKELLDEQVIDMLNEMIDSNPNEKENLSFIRDQYKLLLSNYMKSKKLLKEAISNI
ncbi:hypothetical protein [Ekhidna sp.]